MLISEKNKYIFIAVPKTGTRSVEKYLLENDKTAKRNCVEIEGQTIHVQEHITANKLKEIMGERYNDFVKIGFVRDPYSKIVSSYFFYKNGEAITAGNNSKRFETQLRIYSARILPFEIWSIIYPYKSNINHLADGKNDLIVDFIGRFENLKDDLVSIFNKLNIRFDNHDLPMINK